MSNQKCSTEEWIEKVKKVFPNENYDYSNTIYNGSNENLIIKCIKHGNFPKVAKKVVKGDGCNVCKLKKEFVRKSKEIHNNIYDYSKSVYKNSYTKVKIICNKDDHGEFEQLPTDKAGKKYSA